MTGTVLVTGAGGRTGRTVARALRRRGARPRVVVRAPRRAREVAAELGVDAVYAIPPNVSPDEVVMAGALLEACDRTGVARLVRHSVIHPQLTAMPHYADKRRVGTSGQQMTCAFSRCCRRAAPSGWDSVTTSASCPGESVEPIDRRPSATGRCAA